MTDLGLCQSGMARTKLSAICRDSVLMTDTGSIPAITGRGVKYIRLFWLV